MRISDWSSDVCSSDLNTPEQVWSICCIASLGPGIAFAADTFVGAADFLDHDDCGLRRACWMCAIAVEFGVVFHRGNVHYFAPFYPSCLRDSDYATVHIMF